MRDGRKETLKVRIASAGFTALALAVFKPFGLEAWQWQAYVHPLALWLLGIIVCMMTEGILKYIVKMPQSFKRGVDYIIRRNLWFQLINTPLVALMICIYRHFVLSGRVEENLLSWGNFFETLVIVAFCSFAIGLYWRFKFRSRYLAAELEEIRTLNEQLQLFQQEAAAQAQKPASPINVPAHDVPSAISPEPAPSRITLTGTTSETITLEVSDLLYIEAVGNYVKVYHLKDGQICTDMLRATSKQIEADLSAYSMIVRCHRAFLVNLEQVKQIISRSGKMQLLMKHSQEAIPVSRSNMAQVKDAIKGIN